MHTAALKIREFARPVSRTSRTGHPLVQHLQHLLASSVVLFLNYKHYSWGITGCSSVQMNEIIIEFGQALKASFDEIAGRLRIIGQDPIVTLDKITHLSYVKQSANGMTDLEMLAEAEANTAVMIARIRRAIRAAVEVGDQGSSDLLTKCLRLHERHEWIIRQLLLNSREAEPAALGASS
jgi:starvation-inducible DNA-binding protein